MPDVRRRGELLAGNGASPSTFQTGLLNYQQAEKSQRTQMSQKKLSEIFTHWASPKRHAESETFTHWASKTETKKNLQGLPLVAFLGPKHDA